MSPSMLAAPSLPEAELAAVLVAAVGESLAATYIAENETGGGRNRLPVSSMMRMTASGLRPSWGSASPRTAPGGPLRLGGIDVPHDRHLVGHSDADVLLHAVTDALLGAAALPDIRGLAGSSRPSS